MAQSKRSRGAASAENAGPNRARTGRRAQQRAYTRRQPARAPSLWRGPLPIVIAIVAVLVVIAAFFIYANQGTNSGFLYQESGANQPSKVASAATSVRPAVLDQVGTDGVADPLNPIHGVPALRSGSQPEMLYVGAEYCPYCAAERWSLVIALSRFGTFKGLNLMASESTDVYPNTPTFTFRHATYSSRYLVFVTRELQDRKRQPLQTLTAPEARLYGTYDSGGSIPFIDIGNRYYQVGAGYIPDIIQGKSWAYVAGQLNNPNSQVAQRILGNANYLTAAICKITGNQPGSVCSDPTVQTIEASLGKAG